MNTATNPSSRWLFPGRRAGQPMNAGHLGTLINKLGIPTTAGRSAAIRQHILEMPAPVVADALGYHPSPPPNSLPKPATPGAGTPPVTTHDHPELATVEYASSPDSHPLCAEEPTPILARVRTRRPGPLWWTWYAFGGKLPDRYREWVRHDVTCRSWWLRHVVRSLVQVAPVAILLLVVLGPMWITYLALAAGAILALIYSVAYLEETGEHRLSKHGYPVGTGREVRARRGRRAADEARYNATYRSGT